MKVPYPLITARVALSLTIFSALLLLIGCKGDKPDQPAPLLDRVRINLSAEPDRLNPILSNNTAARQLERFLFCPLEDYNPETLELEPLLLEEKPIIEPVTEGRYAGGTRYTMKILEEATWDDGSPVTGHDYLFTLKLAFNPHLSRTSWKSFLSSIVDVQIDSATPKAFTVITEDNYMLGEEVVCGFHIYPQAIYDPRHTLDRVTLSQLQGDGALPEAIDQELQQFTQEFESEVFSRQKVVGCGPYRLLEWASNQQIILERKEGHWSQNLNDKHPLLQSWPNRLQYYIIPDEQTALTNLKDGQLDIMADVSPEDFHRLQQDSLHSLSLHTPSVLQYYYIAINNQHPILSDVNVRKALSHLIDIKDVIDELFYGLALPTVGPVNPAKPYYNNSLKPVPFSLEAASTLLASSGWKDQDGDKILDKVVNGKVTPLELNIFTTRSQLSQDVAILLQNQALKVGIKINVQPNDSRIFISQVKEGQYELATLATVQTVGFTDPYNSWHSDNIGSNGSNLCKFANEALDRAIENIRHTRNEEVRKQYYLEFQEIIYQEQPAIFLLAPKSRIVSGHHLQLVTSSMRPGYFENMITIRHEAPDN